MSSCCNTRIVTVTGSGTVNTTNLGSALQFDNTSGQLDLLNSVNTVLSSVTIPSTTPTTLLDADGDTSVSVVESGGAAGDSIDFTVDNTLIMSIQNGKIDFNGALLDPPSGLQFEPQAVVPPLATIAANTLWLNSVDSDKLYRGSVNLQDYVSADLNNALIAGTDDKVFLDIDSIGQDRLFVSSALVTNVSDPTTAEIDTAIGTAVNRIVVYNGTTTDTGTYTHVFHVDDSGNVTEIEGPSSTANDHLFIDNTSTAQATPGSPTPAEALTAAGVNRDVFVYFTGTDLNTDAATYIWHVDVTGDIKTLVAPGAAATVSTDGTFVSGDGSVGTPVTIADDALTLAKFASGTPAKYIGYDVAGDPAELDAGKDRVFVSQADVATPTEVSVKAYNDGIAIPNTDTILFYTGTTTDTDPITHVYHVDLTGSVTEILAPAAADQTVLTTDLTADASHTHDFAEFSQTWNNVISFTRNHSIAALPTSTSTVTEGVGSLDYTATNNTNIANLTLNSAQAKLEFADGFNDASFTVTDGSVGSALGVPQTHVKTQGVDAGTSTVGQYLRLTEATNGEVEFSDIALNDRLFADETTVAPALAGDPTNAEISTFAGTNVNVFVVYNGTDTDNDTYTRVYYVDNSGNVTQVENTSAIDTLYSADGSLSGNRTVTLGGSTLSIVPDTGLNTIFDTDGFNGASGWFATPVAITPTGSNPTTSTQTNLSAYTSFAIDNTSTGDITITQGSFNFIDQPYLVAVTNTDVISRDVIFTSTQFIDSNGADLGTITVPAGTVRHLQFFRSAAQSILMFDSGTVTLLLSTIPFTKTFVVADWTVGATDSTFTLLGTEHGKGTAFTTVDVYEDLGAQFEKVNVDTITIDAITGDVTLTVDNFSGAFDGYVEIS